jgi:hypothetical protein
MLGSTLVDADDIELGLEFDFASIRLASFTAKDLVCVGGDKP